MSSSGHSANPSAELLQGYPFQEDPVEDEALDMANVQVDEERVQLLNKSRNNE